MKSFICLNRVIFFNNWFFSYILYFSLVILYFHSFIWRMICFFFLELLRLLRFRSLILDYLRIYIFYFLFRLSHFFSNWSYLNWFILLYFLFYWFNNFLMLCFILFYFFLFYLNHCICLNHFVLYFLLSLFLTLFLLIIN